MYEVLKKGGRKSNATLLTMFIITGCYLLQYPQTMIFMILEMNGICFDHYWIEQFPRMTPAWYGGFMVTLIGLFGASNAYTHKADEAK